MSSTSRGFHEKYFQILEDYFGVHFERMKKKRQGTLEATRASLEAYNPALADSVFDTLFEELTHLDWDSVEHGLRQQGGVKAFIQAPVQFLLSPKSIKKQSLYADTVALSPPIVHTRRVNYQLMEPIARLSQIIHSSLSLLQMKELFLADTTPPIAVLVRPAPFSNDASHKLWSELADRDGLHACSEVFDTTFSSESELLEFVQRHITLDNLCHDAKKPEVFASHAPSLGGAKYPFREALELAMKATYGFFSYAFSSLNDPELLTFAVEFGILGAISATDSQLFSCGSYGAQPIADDRKEWQRLIWKFEHDNEFFAEKLGTGRKDSLVMNALRLDDFSWLGNVPIEGIVKLREDGELQNVRDTLSRGIERIETVSDEDFSEVTRQVGYNLDQEFKRHKTQLKNLDEKFRRKYNFDVASVAVGGSIAVISALFQPLAVAAGIVGGGSLMKFISDVLAERSKKAELRRKPVALLFEAYEDK